MSELYNILFGENQDQLYKITHLPEQEIDRLRFKAFASNESEDIMAYYKATALYFQERHERALNRELMNKIVVDK
jgi:hypothetical protein